MQWPAIGSSSSVVLYCEFALRTRRIWYAPDRGNCAGRARARRPCLLGRVRCSTLRHAGGARASDASRSGGCMRLQDRVAIVTGGGSGIGRATALLFGREGCRVAVVDLREDAAKATAEAIEQAGGHAVALRADVSQSRDNEATVAAAVARWGRLDILYANAGVPQAP